ncbi:microsomal glutathione S-transferase 1-like [Mercenaria mercenaria]|uniref:microsomal glutathione S-transferase 1-like n=1 Tax=Mercenaria mercenaria TaxID=6596 RepID=UPI00234EC91B|nr:microsomal glutathione S-transferase 1-like [Mercenaria mercenaria]
MATFKVDVDNDILQCLFFWAGIVLLKTIFMSLLTSINRISKQVFTTPEDYAMVGKDVSVATDPYIERIRSCHRNDLENVIPFILIGVLYMLVVPKAQWACTYFRVFGISRLIHTVVYLMKVPQPARALSFAVGLTVNFMMVVSVLRSVAW